MSTYKAERHAPCIYTADESERLLRGADMLFRHYRAAVKPAEGVRFFEIRPK